jgi:predicted membrane protein
MKLVLSGIIVFSIVLYVLSIFSAFYDVNLTPKLLLVAAAIGGISAVFLIIILIRERLHDREVEKDDLSKY